MEAAQMNVRLDRALKQSGDAVIATRGYTPSRVVRALWEYLSVHDELPAALERVLRHEDLGDVPASPDSVADEGERIVAEFYERVGIGQPEVPVDYERLREDAALDRLREWGFA